MGMKSGPLRKVTRQRRNGLHGKSRWNIEMECGHVDRASRKSPRAQRRCATCLKEQNAEMSFDLIDYSHIEAKLASVLDLDPGQVTVSGNGGYIALTPFDVAKLTS
jgi:hypothetical protein